MKKSKNKKGFTLVELIVTIVLLGVIGTIIIYNMTSVSTNSKETEYERFIATVKSAASAYADVNQEAFNELYLTKAYLYITVDDLVTNGYLDENLTNPYTNEKIGLDEKIKATLDTTSGAVTFEYPLTSTEEESTIVAISDYVVWGEEYDCMQGAGSYELALADEEGNLIDMSNADNVSKYNFTCSFPDGFTDSDNDGKYNTTTAGNYEITYTWVTEDNVRKEATRVLRVLGKVSPSFKTNVGDYDFRIASDRSGSSPTLCSNCDSDNYYQTSYNDGTWSVLTYEALIEGADTSTTTFKISKISSSSFSKTATNWTDVTGGYVSSYPAQQADDGAKTYKIEVRVTGHYDTSYYYDATGYGEFKAELIIPSTYINSAASSSWVTNMDYSITSDTTGKQSKVGIARYEYRLSNEESLSKSESARSSNLFNKTGTITVKNVNMLNGTTCVDEIYSYKYVYFRAINNEGYAGKWTRVTANMTNSASTLISTVSNGSSTCGDSCYFTSKQVYIKFAGQLFVVLEKYSDGTILVALDGDTGVRVSPLDITNGTVSVSTCDKTFHINYNFRRANKNIINEANNWLNRTIGSSSHIVQPAFSGTGYAAYTITASLLNKYKYALDNGSHNVWLLNQYTEYETITREYHTVGSTTVSNAYFTYAKGLKTYKQYAGQSEYVKPIIKLKNLAACGGSGTSSDPYTVAS